MPQPDEMRFVIFPAGPADAEALASVHVTSWRETYAGLLAPAFLARMSEPGHGRRFARALARPGAGDVTLAAANRHGLVGYAAGGPSHSATPGEAEVRPNSRGRSPARAAGCSSRWPIAGRISGR